MESLTLFTILKICPDGPDCFYEKIISYSALRWLVG